MTVFFKNIPVTKVRETLRKCSRLKKIKNTINLRLDPILGGNCAVKDIIGSLQYGQ